MDHLRISLIKRGLGHCLSQVIRGLSLGCRLILVSAVWLDGLVSLPGDPRAVSRLSDLPNRGDPRAHTQRMDHLLCWFYVHKLLARYGHNDRELVGHHLDPISGRFVGVRVAEFSDQLIGPRKIGEQAQIQAARRSRDCGRPVGEGGGATATTTENRYCRGPAIIRRARSMWF